MEFYYIFGLQRTGTNYLETLISKNFHVKKANDRVKCWKHSTFIPDHFSFEIPAFILFKNPYLWIESVAFRYSADYVRTQDYRIESDLLLGNEEICLSHLIHTYKKFYKTWHYPNLFHVIYYEDILLNPTHFLDGLNYERRTPKKGYKFPVNGTIPQSRNYDEESRTYYVRQKPIYLKPQHIHYINYVLGEDFFHETGYRSILHK